MKLSKKIVAIALSAALMAAQMTVFPHAANSYASGLDDGASYALKVPELESVTRDTSDVSNNWILSSATMGRNQQDTGYAGNTSGYIFTVTDSGERFFKLTPSADKAYVTFVNTPYHTYFGESPRIYNGIPASVGSVSGMVFRVKGLATANKTMGLEISIGNKTGASATYIGQTDVMFVDANTGAVTALTYSATEGYSLPGNANGYIYIPVAGFETTAGATLETDFTDVATTSSSSNLGFRSIRYRFLGTSFNNETALIGDAFVVDSFDNFKKVHAAPAAPALLEATATSIKVTAVSGVKYSIDGINWNTSGEFTNLAEATNYTVYAKYDHANAKCTSSAVLSTKGVVAPILLSKTSGSLTVYVKAEQVYSIDGKNWGSTGVFDGLEANKVYTIYTKSADDINGENIKSADFKTDTAPYSTGYDDGAYFALEVPDNAAFLSDTYLTTQGLVGQNAYISDGFLPIKNIDGENFISLKSINGMNGSAFIKTSLLTYGSVSGVPSVIADRGKFKAIAVRVKAEGGEFYSSFDISISGYKPIEGEYLFLDEYYGETYEIYYYEGFDVDPLTDGWIILPFENLYKDDVALNPTSNSLSFNFINIYLTNYYSDEDWVDRTLYIGNSLFITDVDKFLYYYAPPQLPEIDERTKTSITFVPREGVEYSIDGGKTWNTSGHFENLTPETYYTFLLRYVGRTKTVEFEVPTRLNNPILTKPELLIKGEDFIFVFPEEDHLYSIDGGKTWNELGLFMELNRDTKYEIVAKIYGTDAPLSETTTVRTYPSVWATENNDSTSYIYEIPDAERWEQSWGWGGAPLSSDGNDGAKPLITEIDGERFVKMTCYTSGEGYLNMTLSKYSETDSGLPYDIYWDDSDAVAIRLKFVNMDDKPSQIKICTDTGANDTLTMGSGNIYWVEKTTGAVRTEKASSVLTITGNFDGWLVVPKAAIYNKNLQTLEWMRDSWMAITPWLIDDNGVKSKWRREDGTQEYCYFGNTLLVHDLDVFLGEHAFYENKISNVKATASDVDVTLSWNAFDTAVEYYAKVYDYAFTKCLKTITTKNTSASFDYKLLSYNTNYKFIVTAKLSDGSYLTVADATRVVGAMEIGSRVVGHSLTMEGKGAVVDFLPVEGAEEYMVNVFENNANGTRIYNASLGLSTSARVMTNLSAGTKYVVMINVKLDGRWTSLADLRVNGVGISFTAPVYNPASVTIAAETATSIRFNWDKVRGATQYFIKVTEKATGKVVNTLNVVGKETATLSRWTDGTRISPNTTYVLQFYTYINSTVNAGAYGEAIEVTTPDYETVSITATKSGSKIDLNWNSTSNSVGYFVYTYKNGVKIANRYLDGKDKTTLSLSAPTDSGTYTYGVVAYEKNSSGTAYTPVSVSNQIEIL